MSSGTSLASALAAIDEAWAELRRNPWVKRSMGERIERLPDISLTAITARSERAMALLADIDAIDPAKLPEDIAATLAVARLYAQRWSREAAWYWTVFDPLGIGTFAGFAPTAYCAGWLLNTASEMLAGHEFARPGDLDRYLGLIDDYACLVEQLTLRTIGQAERGIHVPLPQLDASIALIERLRAGAAAMLVPVTERLATVADGATATIAAAIERSVTPAFNRMLDLLRDPDYRAVAPGNVGLAQYPQGSEIYEALVCDHTTLDLTPAEIHAIGIERGAAIHARLDALAAAQGHTSVVELEARIAADPAWRAETPEAIGAAFQRYIDRFAPHIDRCFNFQPAAPYGAAPLPEALSGAMTFGYYAAPSRGQVAGTYLYNAANLARSPTASLATLTYHELVPGHHFHIASQIENQTLHPLRRYAFINAFNEGWAEYAATLAGETGMYEAVAEDFGRLIMDAFLTTRLVVDTGMHAFGWSLEQARDYMRTHAFLPEAEIASETLRYACSMPAQALAYKLGEHFLITQRALMAERLGDRFDLRVFHDAVLRPGNLPLSLVAANLDRATRDRMAA